MITFVVYHTKMPAESAKVVTDYTASLEEKEWQSFLENYEAYISTCFQSAKHFHPDCRCVVLTDQKTPFTIDEEVIRYDLDPSQPAYMRLIAQMKFLKQSPSHTVFLDYDILIQTDLTPLFESEFDLALTYRNKKETPINGGLILIRQDRIPQAYLFLEKVKKIYDTIYMDKFRIWGGVQRALKDAIGLEAIVQQKNDTQRDRTELTFTVIEEKNGSIQSLNVEGVKLLLLPADEYNFSTQDDRQMTGHYPEKKILHFKGNRKHQMLPYWETYFHME